MKAVDYGHRERLRRNARILLACEVLEDIELRCASKLADAGEIARTVCGHEQAHFDALVDAMLGELEQALDDGKSWRDAVIDARNFVLRPWRDDRLPEPLPGQLRLPEMAAATP